MVYQPSTESAFSCVCVLCVHRYYKGRFGGYAGEAAPEKVFELLSQDDNIFLVDIRSEVQREKEGLPQLKLGARFKVAAFPLQVCVVLVACVYLCVWMCGLLACMAAAMVGCHMQTCF